MFLVGEVRGDGARRPSVSFPQIDDTADGGLYRPGWAVSGCRGAIQQCLVASVAIAVYPLSGHTCFGGEVDHGTRGASADQPQSDFRGQWRVVVCHVLLRAVVRSRDGEAEAVWPA